MNERNNGTLFYEIKISKSSSASFTTAGSLPDNAGLLSRICSEGFVHVSRAQRDVIAPDKTLIQLLIARNSVHANLGDNGKVSTMKKCNLGFVDMRRAFIEN
ncbi:hypothetical protein AVEN_37708-1 [Araneus ventricosus]|uniref:Uncharacterized protein n=1 Tax=Araneus ventricosus TaxID=182803 RepID=A0A4Y2BSQ7_ARAVE|nr:hypothetical protein AVEN_37708-1 [Araneus ventricosus]